MKKIIIAAFLLVLANSLYGQGNVEEYIFKYGESKSAIISKGRMALLDNLLNNDENRVREVREYLINDVEDQNYIVLYPWEDWLILYYLKWYDELLEKLETFDADKLSESYRTKIRPVADALQYKLEENSVEYADEIEESIRTAELSDEEKDFLSMNFARLIVDPSNDIYVIDTLNDRADRFLAEYPGSRYENYVRKNIRYKMVPKNWGFGVEFFSGYGIFTGSLKDSYTDNVPIGAAFDITYKKFELYLRNYIGFNRTKEDKAYSAGVFEKRSPLRVFLPEASLGYAVFDNNRFKISPFAGVAATMISPTQVATEKTPELKELEVNAFTYAAGLNFDIKFGPRHTPAFSPKTNYGFVRIRYAYTNPRVAKKYNGLTGSMHYITIGFGMFSRGVKMDY